MVPIGPNGTNTTTAARSGNLTLIAALPGSLSPAFYRCGQGCAAQSSSGSLVACGHMYLDQGAQSSLCILIASVARLRTGQVII